MEIIQLLVLLFATGDEVAATFTLSPEYSYVVKDDQLQLNCSSSEPNTSVQTFEWWIPIQQTQAYVTVNGCRGAGLFIDKTSYKITCTDTWSSVLFKNITRNQTGIYWQCNELQQQQSKSNRAYVLYTVPVESVEMESRADDMAIVENTSTIFRCQTSKSLPAPKIFWFLMNPGFQQINITEAATQTPSAGGGINSVTVKSDLNYVFNRSFNGWLVFCMATNTRGQNLKSSKTELIILYPSEVGLLSNTSLKESSTLNITCPVIPGNPVTTEVFWTRKRDSRQWNSSQLIILNVSRADDAVYTCTVSNEMIPTVGNVTKSPRNSEFHLNVFFSSEIRVFLVFGKDSKEVVMVNQTEEVSFICTTEANPAADITMRGPQYEHIAMVSSRNTLSHAIRNTSCVNAGEYICSSRNNYTHGHASTSRLILIVRCAPRPSSDSTHASRKIISTLHADVTLQFTARDYLDEPNKTTFMWFKNNVSVENDDSKFVMSSHGLQSNLSIRNITQRDFGRYELLVSNSVGHYMHLYQLMAKDKPEVPMGFAYMEDSITDSSVTLKWTPGFNGGYKQLFLVFYKIKTGQQWQNKTIIDTGDKEMKHNLSGLVGMTEYQVKMFARNDEGDSAYTDSIQFTTKASSSRPQNVGDSSNTAAFVAVGAGASVTTLIIGAVVFISYRRLRWRSAKSQKVENHPENQTANMNMKTYDGIGEYEEIQMSKAVENKTENVGNQTGTSRETESTLQYERIDNTKQETNQYSQLQVTSESRADTTRETDKEIRTDNDKTMLTESDYVNMRI